MKKQLQGSLLLLVTAMIWGAAFVAQTVGMDYVEPFTYQAVRQFMGFLILLPVIFIRNKRKENRSDCEKRAERKTLLLGGLGCGVFLFTATILQQFGLTPEYGTTAGRSGFITALYVLIVPLIGLLTGRKVRPLLWCAVAIAITGMYFLCFSGSLSFGMGEFLTLLCAFCFAGHILLIARVSPGVDSIKLSALQFLVSSLISAVFMLFTEHPRLPALLDCWLPLCYSGFISCGVAYTLQIIAQKHVKPVVATILMSTESVFAALSGWLLIGQAMQPREILGCGLMFVAILLAQIPERSAETA